MTTTAYTNAFPNWQATVLKLIKAPVTAANVAWLTAWHSTEGSNASNNPLNTTQPAPGATSINSVGVKSYGSASVGAAATAQTLLNGRYPKIVAALQSGDPVAYTFSDANAQGSSDSPLVKELQKWGSHGFASDVAANEIPNVSASTGNSLGNNPASTLADAAGQTFSGFFGGLEQWVTNTAGYALLYLALVGFSIVLAILGVLSMLGVHPRTALARGAEAAAA